MKPVKTIVYDKAGEILDLLALANEKRMCITFGDHPVTEAARVLLVYYGEETRLSFNMYQMAVNLDTLTVDFFDGEDPDFYRWVAGQIEHYKDDIEFAKDLYN